MVRKDWVKQGAVVLDVGINVVEERSPSATSDQPLLRVFGDVAFDEVSFVAAAITPVPCGIGPMTIAAVVHNTICAAKFSHGISSRIECAPSS